MPLSAKALLPAMREKLSESGLSPGDAKKLGFELLTREQLVQRYPNISKLPAGGFLIPYHDIDGKRTKFFRFRYLEKPQRTGFDALTTHKPMRYIQPAGAKPIPYFSRMFPWREFLNRPAGERQLFFTEGELKADCACKLGIPTIGLGGVWNFKHKDKPLLPELEAIDWNGVMVGIVYDSDAISNYQVIRAENELARQLLQRGARICVLRLPKLNPEKKTGLDDYLVAKGANEFWDLAENTPPWEACRVLHELNEEIVFVRNPGLVVELKNFQRMRPHDFTHSIYANRIWNETVETQGGKVKVVQKSAAAEWLKWPSRAEVPLITYAPGQPMITSQGELNTWRGWGMNGTTIAPGDIKPWNTLLDLLLDGARNEDRRWFEQWLAFPLQYPGTKLNSAVVLWGIKEGTGKSLLGYTMKRIYGANFNEINEEDLNSSFNQWAENKQFIMGEEIAGGDKRIWADRLKSFITRQNITVNAKYIPPYQIPDCINYYFTSNHPDSFFLSDNDRRYFIHEVHKKPFEDTFYKEYDRWYKSDAVGALFYYLLNDVDTTTFNHRQRPPVTDSKLEMIDLGRSDLGAWVATLRDDPDRVLKMGEMTLPYSLMTSEEIHACYDPMGTKKVTSVGMGRELKRAGFLRVNNYKPVNTHTRGTQYLWAIRDPESFLNLNPGQLREVYDREHNSFGSNSVPKKKEKF